MKKNLTYHQRLALKVWSALPSHQINGTWHVATNHTRRTWWNFTRVDWDSLARQERPTWSSIPSTDN